MFKNEKKKINFTLSSQKLGMYKNLFILFYKSFIRNFRNVFFVFVMPLFFMILFFFVMKGIIQGNDNSIKAGYIMLGPITAGITSLSVTVAEWKNSIFLKRLDATPITKTQFLSTLIVFYFITSVISTIWLFIWSIIIDPKATASYISTINWGYFILGVILFILISISFGLFIGGVSTSVGMAQGLALTIYFPSIFLSGIMIPGYAIDSVRNLFNDIGYIFPHKYASSVLIYGWNYSDWNSSWMHISLIKALGFPKIYIPIIVSLAWTALIYTGTVFTFKWDVRK